MSGPEEQGGPGPAPTPPPQPAAPAAASAAASVAMSAMEGMFRSFSVPEQFMVGGAVLVLAADLLLGALLGGGGAFVAVVLASAELLLAVWLKNRRSIVWPASYGLILSALVVAVAILEADDFLDWIHQATLPGGIAGGGIALLTSLCEWAGAILMSWGAVSYWRAGGQ